MQLGSVRSSEMGGDVVLTAGADSSVGVLDPRAGFAVSTKFTEHRYAHTHSHTHTHHAMCRAFVLRSPPFTMLV